MAKKKSQEARNPPMPDKAERPTITLPPMKATLCMSERYSSGSMHMTMDGFGGKVSEGDKEVGEVLACLGGGVELRIGAEHFFLDMVDLWKAFHEAVKEQWLKESANDAATDA